MLNTTRAFIYHYFEPNVTSKQVFKDLSDICL
jgi:hypothetical protein